MQPVLQLPGKRPDDLGQAVGDSLGDRRHEDTGNDLNKRATKCNRHRCGRDGIGVYSF